MQTASPADTSAIYIERLRQALRVMEGLSDVDRTNFNINVIAQRTEAGIAACIAGHCGLDPWFQDRGLKTIVGEGASLGDVPVSLTAFFGTGRPFFSRHYSQDSVGRVISSDDAIAALKQAIETLSGTSSSKGEAQEATP